MNKIHQFIKDMHLLGSGILCCIFIFLLRLYIFIAILRAIYFYFKYSDPNSKESVIFIIKCIAKGLIWVFEFIGYFL